MVRYLTRILFFATWCLGLGGTQVSALKDEGYLGFSTILVGECFLRAVHRLPTASYTPSNPQLNVELTGPNGLLAKPDGHSVTRESVTMPIVYKQIMKLLAR